MSSFFKGSCFIFWITWLLCLSYWMGTERFYANHVMNDPAMQKSIYMMYVIVILNTTFGFVGCLFLKCNVNNVCCVILFCIPVGLVVPIMSAWNAYTVSKQQKVPTQNEAFKMLEKHLKSSKYKTAPVWLTQTEREYKCCGIKGPSDYRKLFQSAPSCAQLKLDIPCSCCAHVRGEDPEPTDFGRTMEFNSCFKTRTKNERCLDRGSGNRNWMEEVFVTFDTTTNSSVPLTLQAKCDRNTTLTIDQELVFTNETGILSDRPCYPDLETNYNMMKTCQVTFFVMFAICPLLMFVAYIRYFCKSSVISGQRSDYSLDVETLSMIETPFSDPLPYLSKHEID